MLTLNEIFKNRELSGYWNFENWKRDKFDKNYSNYEFNYASKNLSFSYGCWELVLGTLYYNNLTKPYHLSLTKVDFNKINIVRFALQWKHFW